MGKKKSEKIWKIEKLRKKNVEIMGEKLSDKNDPKVWRHSARDTGHTRVTNGTHTRDTRNRAVQQ